MPERFKPLFRLIRRVQIPWLLLACACVLTLIETGIALWVPLLTRDLIDSATSGAISQPLVGTLVGVLLVQALFSALGIYLLARAAAQLTAFLREHVVAHLLRLPMSFHDEQRSGELVSRTLSDTESIEELLTQQTVYCISSVLSIVGAIAILWFLDWRLTLVLFGSALLGLLLVLPVAARLQGIGKEIQDRQADFSGRLAGVLADMRLLKASCAESEETRRAGGSIQSLRGLALREARIYAVLGPTVTLGVSGAMVVILGYGGARVASGALAVGTLVAFILYLFQVVMPMVQFSTFVAALNKAAGAAEHLSGLLDEEPEDSVPEGDDAGGAFGVDLVLDGIRHAYGESEVLRDVDLRIPAGRVTALVGPSGGGKTTILSLLERFYAPSDGRLLLGDREAQSFELESWRRSIGYVTQEAPLLAGTVRENLCFGLESEPSDEAVQLALEAARADGFVAALEKGLDTEVGERGVKLSGGQRQRLAIARAFLVDPDLLILDEATANLDAESEAAVRDALQILMRGRTTLIVAHRLATVRDADQIAVLEDGRVSGTGTHRQLLETHEVYRELVEQQSLAGRLLPA